MPAASSCLQRASTCGSSATSAQVTVDTAALDWGGTARSGWPCWRASDPASGVQGATHFRDRDEQEPAIRLLRRASRARRVRAAARTSTSRWSSSFAPAVSKLPWQGIAGEPAEHTSADADAGEQHRDAAAGFPGSSAPAQVVLLTPRTGRGVRVHRRLFRRSSTAGARPVRPCTTRRGCAAGVAPASARPRAGAWRRRDPRRARRRGPRTRPRRSSRAATRLPRRARPRRGMPMACEARRLGPDTGAARRLLGGGGRAPRRAAPPPGRGRARRRRRRGDRAPPKARCRRRGPASPLGERRQPPCASTAERGGRRRGAGPSTASRYCVPRSAAPQRAVAVVHQPRRDHVAQAVRSSASLLPVLSIVEVLLVDLLARVAGSRSASAAHHFCSWRRIAAMPGEAAAPPTRRTFHGQSGGGRHALAITLYPVISEGCRRMRWPGAHHRQRISDPQVVLLNDRSLAAALAVASEMVHAAQLLCVSTSRRPSWPTLSVLAHGLVAAPVARLGDESCTRGAPRHLEATACKRPKSVARGRRRAASTACWS